MSSLRCPHCAEPFPPSMTECPRCGADITVVVLDATLPGAGRPIRRGRRWLVATLVLLGVAGLLWITSRLTSAPSEPIPSTPTPSAVVTPQGGQASATALPPMVAGRAFICPLGWPFHAYTGDRRVYYPPNHPFRPPNDVEPDGCFGSERAAEAAGYEVAPIPPGYRLIDGFYLRGFDLQGACGRAATATGLVVPCPVLLPAPASEGTQPACEAPTSFGAELRPPCVWQHAFVFEYSGFGVPPGYDVDGVDGGTHLVITAYGPDDPKPDPETPFFLQCPDGTAVGSILLPEGSGVRKATLVRCPVGLPPNSDHILLRWTRQGIEYAVSLHGDSQANRYLLIAIAGALYYAPP